MLWLWTRVSAMYCCFTAVSCSHGNRVALPDSTGFIVAVSASRWLYRISTIRHRYTHWNLGLKAPDRSTMLRRDWCNGSNSRKRDRISPLLRDLRWSRVPERIKFRRVPLLHMTTAEYTAGDLQWTVDEHTEADGTSAHQFQNQWCSRITAESTLGTFLLVISFPFPSFFHPYASAVCPCPSVTFVDSITQVNAKLKWRPPPCWI